MGFGLGFSTGFAPSLQQPTSGSGSPPPNYIVVDEDEFILVDGGDFIEVT